LYYIHTILIVVCEAARELLLHIHRFIAIDEMEFLGQCIIHIDT